jgi:hypothetical protein
MGFLARLFGAVPKAEREGIMLDYRTPQWKISKSKDLPSFLRALIDLLPPGSMLYFEGGSPSGKLLAFLNERSVPEQSHVAMGTIWPRPKIFHVPATPENLNSLVELTGSCASPELAVHVHVYFEEKVLLQWYDAFSDPFYISKDIPESKVSEFCGKLQLHYVTDEEGVQPAVQH